MQRDRFRLRNDLKRVQKLLSQDPPSKKAKAKPPEQQLEELTARLDASVDLCTRRAGNRPTPHYDQSLPIFSRKEEICSTIRENQVVVISGETGSGKSTQLPLMALEMGYGVSGLIGHTQPRRIAARGVAARIGSQLKRPGSVGYKIRFADQTGDDTYIKLMTDGILLAETRSDRFLDQYDLIIVDEAHERSLNIDFLLGCLYRIIQKRPELRLVITSATIDTEKFAEHFSAVQDTPVPVIHVEGRTYPVEIRYRPIEGDQDKQQDIEQAVLDACREITAEESGDILVFLPTENDIRAIHKKLRGVNFPGGATDVLPLYARLSTAQQNLIFQPHKNRHIILATNVAESSITVPGIRAVVDTGTARISRYAPRSKVQRLPIEPVSRASANQRSGRCGRVGPGICVRLFSEEDYQQRTEFTTPEIRRTNLASVILQTLALRLGDIGTFPFIDPPHSEAIRDGYKTLFEIGAVDDYRRLTDSGRRLARLPVDPRIGRMIFQADEENCLSEILIITSALELQDPRQRPAEKRNAADAQHEKFKNEKSDFLSLLNVWDFFHDLKESLSRSKLKLACQQNFISYSMMRQWQDIHRQLKAMASDAGLKPGKRKDDYDSIHRSLLSGLLSGVALLGDRYEYTGSGGIKFHLWPGSGVFESKPRWIVAGEIVETSRRYGRTIGGVQPQWIEKLAEHLIRKHYSDPGWSRKQQTIMANEKVTLFGLPVVAARRVGYARIDPEYSRRIFIEEALASEEVELTGNYDFYRHNLELLEQLKSEAAKTRDRNLVIDRYLLMRFYEENLPDAASDPATLRRMIKQDSSVNESLKMSRADLVNDGQEQSTEDLFPDEVQVGSMHLPVKYAFEPGTGGDGATVELPVEGISQIDDMQAGWLIPGLMEARITAMIKSLPKAQRRALVPAPQTACRVVEALDVGVGSFNEAVAAELSRIAGEPLTARSFDEEKIENHLRINMRVLDNEGEVVAEGRTMAELRSQLGAEHADNVVEVEDNSWKADGLKDWDWDELPGEVTIQRGQTQLPAYPAIVDQESAVGLRLTDSRPASDQLTRCGLVRLFSIANRKSVKAQTSHLPDLDGHSIHLARFIPAKDLRRHLGDLIIRIAFVDRQKIPRSREAFDERQSNAVERISIAAQEVARWLPKWTDAVHQATLRLESMSGKYSSAKGAIREQTRRLTSDGFLGSTTWRWLEHYPRYFEAMAVRIEKLPGLSPDKERELRDTVASFQNMHDEQVLRHADHAIVDPELEQFRWMIEELRVSLFAQTLGTSLTVSEKRLMKQWKKVRQV
ncbi:MAG: ATP-dependent RNA helicase HrpA [Planctomycetota bacterium]